MNFANSQASSETINRFVAEKTQGKITNLIKPEILDADTRVVLINAIYFKGDWQHKFEKSQTKKDDFFTSETETIKADFMHIRKSFNYSYIMALEAAVLEMKYANSDLSFVIILPNKRNGLSTLEEKLKNFDFKKMIGSLFTYEVIVTIPKFKIEFEINLNYILAKV